jgi:hypothetical protein
MISNLSLLFFALWKAGMLTGVLPGIVIAVFFGRYRIVEVGFEQVRGGSEGTGAKQAENGSALVPIAPPRKVRAA